MTIHIDPNRITAQERETLARDLERAADHLDEHGWVQGTYESEDGRCCALGALDASLRPLRIDARRKKLRYHRARRALVTQLVSEGKPRSVARYNDAPARRKSSVTALLRRTARILRGAKR